MSPMNPRLLVPRASGLTNPATISGLQLWLDASDVSGMAQLSNGTTAVTADDDPVGYWADKSGNGYHATQTDNNNRPKYRVGVRNGRSTLRWDGTNDSYRVASIPLDATISVFVACQFNVAGLAWPTTGNLFIEHSTNSNSFSGFLFSGSSNSAQQINRIVSPTFRFSSLGVAAWVGTDWNVVECRFSPGTTIDGVLASWKNGVQQANNGSAAGATTQAGTVTSSRSVTADLFLGARNQASAFSNGDYAEILIYNRPLTDGEHTAVRRYLGRKWGITVT